MSQYNNVMSYARTVLAAAAMGAASVAYAGKANDAARVIAPHVMGSNGYTAAQNHERHVKAQRVEENWGKVRIGCPADGKTPIQFSEVYTAQGVAEYKQRNKGTLPVGFDGYRSMGRNFDLHAPESVVKSAIGSELSQTLEEKCKADPKGWVILIKEN